MIRKIDVENFKSLRNVTLNLGALSILAGRNGSGKSSLVQALLCVNQLTRTAPGIVPSLDLKSLRLGTVQDIVYQFATDEVRAVVLRASIKEDGQEVSEEYVLPVSRDNYGKEKLPLQDGGTCSISLGNVRWLFSNRKPPETIHEYSSDAVDAHEIGKYGEYAVANLLRHGDEEVVRALCRIDQNTKQLHLDLRSQVTAWMQVFAEAASVRADAGPTSDTALLHYEFGAGESKRSFSPENVGVGLSSVLPVLVMVLMAKPGDLLIVEDPESDLHPRAQSDLAQLFAQAATAGIQIVIETHSDHIVNGARIAVKKGFLSKDELRIAFCKRNVEWVDRRPVGEQFSYVNNLEVDENGEIQDPPHEFLDEWGRQIDILMEDAEDGVSE